MSENAGSGYVKDENFYEGRILDDQDRRQIIVDRNPSVISKALRRIFSPKETGKGEALKSLLTHVATAVTKKRCRQYPFLTLFGDEDFDKRILTDSIRSYTQRVRNDKKNWRAFYNPVSFEEQTVGIRHAVNSVYKHHIPTYESVFADLDQRKAAQEIFIGRDAIFMYFARKAQLWGKGQSGAGRVKYLV